jgi:hypothetical protein
MSAVRVLAGLFSFALVAGSMATADAMPVWFHDLTFPIVPAASHGTNPHRVPRHRAYATSSDIGSSGDVTADMLVQRPNETPCVDTLFTGAQFAAYSPQTFAYTPPPGCPGPYAKIVFNGDFAVTAGDQFDRTASIQIGSVPIYFGTTAEPNGTYGPTWHFERDVTDDAALLASPQTTEADIFNIVNSTYTGVISGTTYLQFYPATTGIPAAATPDVVLPVPGVTGGPQALNTGSSTLSATYTFPTNVTQAYLDVYSQGQQNDEFYYTCVPNDVSSELDSCGNGPFRETEISIDGIPAGEAPVTPWIFTGGIDPFLWTPFPGAQTLGFTPYRVNLTPFAGLLSNGKPHAITLSVDNADQYFSEIATLFLYRDPGAKTVRGGVVANNLVLNPTATVTENITDTLSEPSGTIDVSNSHSYEIAGFVQTSKGTVHTIVDSALSFSNDQDYSNETPVTGTESIAQTTAAKTTTRTVSAGGVATVTSNVSYPLTVDITSATAAEDISIDQVNDTALATTASNGATTTSSISNEVKPSDVYQLADGAVTGNSAQQSTQTYEELNPDGTCYEQQLTAVANTLLGVSNPTCTSTMARRRAQWLRQTVLRPLPMHFRLR